ncbi:MAG TPA: hypothetical protein VGM90_05570 [Kofleriaceae bacterium]|jgi:hypothetical protein
MRTALLFSAALAVFVAARPADACQLKGPVAELSHLRGKKTVVLAHVTADPKGGYLLTRTSELAGKNTPATIHLDQGECVPLKAETDVVLGLDDKMQPDSSGMVPPTMGWPEEPENQALILAFVKAKDDKEIAKILVQHAHKGWASYVDFPQIAYFLAETPAVVNEMTKAQAKQLLADLNHHPRAAVYAKRALAKRAS